MTQTIHDESQRNRALDPTQSFIVQAPAGSGKTELLTQRFLVLLSQVKQPEEILAITFTKKSAAEMRTRIIHALENAVDQPEPELPHAKKTWTLAKKVLQQDALYHWQLLKNSSRLRIQTIDSFNSSLTRHLPILSHFGATPDIIDNPFLLYRQAVQEFLSHLEENVTWSDAIATLLLHMDNDLNKVEELLINLLAKRDQWLPYITINSSDPLLRKKLQSHLKDAVTEILNKLQELFPKELAEEILYLLRYSAANLLNEKPDSPIIACLDLTSFPCATLEDRKYWHGIQELLFKKSDETWRKKIDKTMGFPTQDYFNHPQEKYLASQAKQRMTHVLEQMNHYPDLLNAFIDLKYAPATEYEEAQWQTLEALHQVLCVVVAELKLIFQQHGKIDYIENASAALAALGTDEAPTDLALILDYQIKHILIDEFQDTSNTQYRLLEKLISGWQDGDGKTLFLVGDPMQSIYRFREAEVGLFIRARQRKIGDIRLEPLTLSVNFRSTPTIVNWVNQQFPLIFPTYEDIATGAVSYSSSMANQGNHSTSTVMLHAFKDDENDYQANAIIDIIQQQKLNSPNEKIVILVRSRSHLETIIPSLKNAGIAYRAIDIDPLTERPFIQDLIALTRALLHPADRIAWLSILRAPWCGLTLSDLLILSGSDPKINLWERLQDNQVLSLVNSDGQIRLNRLLPIIKNKMGERRRYNLRYLVESTWLLLGGPACLNQQIDLDDVEAYFKLLSKLDHGGELQDFDNLTDHVNKLFAAPDSQASDTLQIMTIHNAKGLEFDTVILPHLERKASNDEKQLMLWMERPRNNESNALILAPVHAIGQDRDSIYEYIKKQQSIKNEYEMARLIYVAVTRAKKHLHLFFNVKESSKPYANSLLEKLWPAIKKSALEIIETQTEALNIQQQKNEDNISNSTIRRLITDWKNPIKEIRLADTISYHKNKAGFLLPDNNPKLVGTLIHLIFQQICLNGKEWWQQQPTKIKDNYLKKHILQLGINFTEDTLVNIHHAIDKTLTDQRGQWILHSHLESHAEYQLTCLIDNEPQQFIIDRTFVDENNIRWIIDYKTSSCLEDDMEIFLNSELQKYKKQMLHYYLAMREMDSRPIKMGLYFPLISGWREWEF